MGVPIPRGADGDQAKCEAYIDYINFVCRNSLCLNRVLRHTSENGKVMRAKYSKEYVHGVWRWGEGVLSTLGTKIVKEEGWMLGTDFFDPGLEREIKCEGM